MSIFRRLSIIILLSFACIGCDQGTKSLASNYLPKYEMNTYFNDVVRIGYIENTGAFLGLGSSLPKNIRFLIFTVLVSIFLLGLFVFLISNSKLDIVSLTGLSLLFSGGLSNLYDRVVNNGAVIDFLNIGIGSIRTGIFNIADMNIMLGFALLVYAQYKYRNILT